MKRKKKASRKTSTSKREKMVGVTLRMDRGLRDILNIIATGASTDLSTTAQVLIVTGMHMGRNGLNAAIQEGAEKIRALEATLARCRNIMEANDPGNAREIFGEPLEREAEFQAAGEAPPAGATP